MTYFWLVENLIKEYARHYRGDKMTLDVFFKELREVVDGELEISSLQERMISYSEADSWDEPAEG